MLQPDLANEAFSIVLLTKCAFVVATLSKWTSVAPVGTAFLHSSTLKVGGDLSRPFLLLVFQILD